MVEKFAEKLEAGSSHSAVIEFYDPSKESIATRLGLTVESFKRAPGTTGYVIPSSQRPAMAQRIPLQWPGPGGCRWIVPRACRTFEG